MEDDCMKILHFLAIKWYHYKYVKLLIKIEMIYYSLLLSCNVIDLVSDLSLLRFIAFGKFFFQSCVIMFVLVLLIIENDLMYDIMGYIKFWKMDTMGEETKNKILNKARNAQYFIIINTTLAVITSVLRCCDAEELNFLKMYLDKWFPNQNGILFSLCKLLLSVTTFTIITHVTAVIYATQHLIFQMLIYNKRTESLKNISNLDVNEQHQNIKFRLKLQIMRHQEFIFWRTHTVLRITPLMLPFIASAIAMFLSSAFCIFTITDSTSYITLGRIFAYIATSFLAVSALIASSQQFQDESEEIFSTFLQTNWYTWNIENQKLYLNILKNSREPLQFKFSENLSVNYQLGVNIFKIVYSTVSLFGDKLSTIN